MTTTEMPVSFGAKAATGIEGFDTITRGGLPRGRSTLLEGGPGSGKTLFALNFLVHGVQKLGEPGMYVAFEEAPDRIVANCTSFGWNADQIPPEQLFFFDARVSPAMVQSGDFDLSGMLAALGAMARQMHAKRIVFDAVDIVLALLPDEQSRRREAYRLPKCARQIAARFATACAELSVSPATKRRNR